MVTFLLGVVAGIAFIFFIAKLVTEFGRKKGMTATIYYDKEKNEYKVYGSLDKIVNSYRVRRFEKPGAIKYID